MSNKNTATVKKENWFYNLIMKSDAAVSVIVVLLGYFITRTLNIIDIFSVKTGSMEDNIHVGDYILIFKKADYDVITQIINDTGLDLQNIAGEIEKICLYLGKDKTEVTTDDFVKISGFTKEINIFMLTNAIEEKNLQYSLFIIEKMMQAGEKAIALLSAVSSAVRKLLTAKSLMEEKGYSSQDALNYIRVYSFFQDKYYNNLRKYSLAHLKKSMNEILKTDIALKTGKTDEKSAIENLVLFICK